MLTYKSTYNSSSSRPTSPAGRLGIHFKMEDRNDLIEHYFNLGYQQKEILSCLLLIHDQSQSSRLLRRILARRGLTRRKHVSKLSTVINSIERELQFNPVGVISVIGLCGKDTWSTMTWWSLKKL